MRKIIEFQKILAMAGACVLMMGSLTACSGNETNNSSAVGNAGNSVASNEEISGTIQIVGSTSMEKFSNALREVFMEKYPEVTVNAEFVGSGAGIEAVVSGTADVGNSSRNLKEDELKAGAVENVVAIDGIAVCTDPANVVEGLSKQQLIDIYTGKINNGKQEVSDFLTGQRKDKDETEWFVVERPEIRIIEDATFERAQEILHGRHDSFNLTHERQSNKHLFSTLIKCKECGWSFRRTVRTY